MEATMTPISLTESFRFSCSADVPCFNACCRDLNQFLTPYDILRLKRHFNITSTAFLERYTTLHTGPESGLPIVSLKADPASELKCPFVTPSGCSVYADRPSSCRIYPLARALTCSKETGRKAEHFALLREPHCRGFQQAGSQTVHRWLEDQGVLVYNEMNDRLMEIISLKNRLMPGPLDMASGRLFHMACYDLDAFKGYLIEREPADDLNMDSAEFEGVINDDVALLKLSLDWIKKVLFGEGHH